MENERKEAERQGSTQGGARLWRCLALGFALALLAGWLGSWLPALPGEPALLRWLRTLAAHPVRGGLALTLLLLAVTPSSASPEPTDPGPTS